MKAADIRKPYADAMMRLGRERDALSAALSDILYVAHGNDMTDSDRMHACRDIARAALTRVTL
jgi:hypothetical protein